MLLRIVVKYQHATQPWLELFDKGQVGRMGQIHVARAGVIEGQGKTIGKAIIKTFRADVRPPFKLPHAGNAVFQLGELVDEFGMLGRRDAVEKVAQDDMAQGGGTSHGKGLLK